MARSALRCVSLHLVLCMMFSVIGVHSAVAQSLFTFTGDFRSLNNDAFAFDGTDFTDLPGLFDSLAGGTFRATYLVPILPPPPSNPNFNTTTYAFGAPYGLSYTLYDTNGTAVVTGAGDPRNNRITVANDVPTFNFSNVRIGTTDNVNMSTFGGSLNGLQTPTALYGPPDLFVGNAGALFFHFAPVPDIPTDLTNLSLPLNPQVYLGFPQSTFSVGAFWGSGDYNDQVDPFQSVDSSITYTIRNVTITAVPEPGNLALLISSGVTGMGVLFRLRRRK